MSDLYGYSETILGLVITDVEDAYEGTKVNDRTLGKMYYAKKYEKAAGDIYDKMRATLSPPVSGEKQVFQTDGKFSALTQQRMGAKKIDHTRMLAELTDLLYKLQIAERVKTPSKNKAVMEASTILEACTVYGKDSTIVTIVESGL